MKRQKRARAFYGQLAAVITAIAGFAISAYGVFWLGKSDEAQQICDIVEDNGSTSMTFHNTRSGKDVTIHMYTD